MIENFSGGVMKKFGLDYESVAPINPRLIYCSISAYGRSGRFATRPGFDPITQAESGFMSLNGFPDGPPVRTELSDRRHGNGACLHATLSCSRCGPVDRLGQGQYVEVALFDIAMAMTGFFGMAYLINGQNPGRFGNSPAGSPTVGLYDAADGPLYAACANDRLYRRLVVEVLERPDLITDPRFATRKARSEHSGAASRHHCRSVRKRPPRELDDEDEAGQHSRWLSPHCRGGVQRPRSTRAAALESYSASDRRLGAKYRASLSA